MLLKHKWNSNMNWYKIKNREKKCLGAPTPPEDQAICLFAGLLANPDVTLIKTDTLRVTPDDAKI